MDLNTWRHILYSPIDQHLVSARTVMGKQEEYEVESIREARVEKAPRSKKNKLVWKYLVRWKGYKADDDTWEPIDSFVGSEALVNAFWERAQTNGRDINDMSLFKAGETFHPVGPPKRPKRKSTNDVSASDLIRSPNISAMAGTSRTSEKRRRLSPDPLDLPPKQRKRSRNDPTQHSPNTQPATPAQDLGGLSLSHPPRSQTRGELASKTTPGHAQRKTRAASPEVIPDSDEEMNLSPSLINYLRSEPSFKSSATAELPDPIQTNEFPAVDKPYQSPTESQPCETIPAHRAREANPLVKRMDFTGLEDVSDAISAKKRALGSQSAVPSSSKASSPTKRAKPGPGRSSSGLLKPQKSTSSLLTFEKGSLKSIKGKYSNDLAIDFTEEKNDPGDAENSGPSPPADSSIPERPLSGEELLAIAGLGSNNTENLSDFEDERVDVQTELKSKPETSAAVETKDQDNPASNIDNASVTRATNNLFPPSGSSEPSPSFNDAWKRSTIFGPLTLGSENTSQANQLKVAPLLLNLDASVSIPLHLSELSNGSIQFSSKMGLKGTPGKFYSPDSAIVLLGTVRAGGTSALATLDERATGEEKTHFEHFYRRLQAGDLFVAVIGMQILVFCSTGNTLLSQRLNAPTSLLNDPSSILVSEVEVENYTGYADATANADDRRWSQIIAAK